MLGFVAKAHTGFLASVAGGEASPVDSLLDLQGGVLWVTDFDQPTQVAQGYALSHAIKSANYFSVSPGDVLRGMGFGNTGEDAVRAVAEVYNRVLTITAAKLQISAAALGAACLEAYSFQEALLGFQFIGRPLPIGFKAGSIDHFAAVRRRRKYVASQATHKIVVPRVPLAMEVMATPVPVGDFVEMTLAGDRDETIALLKYGPPNICLVRIVAAEAALSAVLEPKLRNGSEFWVAQPELTVLSCLATLEVKRCFMADTHVEPSKAYVRTIPTPSFVETIGMSSSIFHESLMYALSLPILGAGEADGLQHSRSAWVSSALRAESMLLAMEAAVNGLGVVGFDGPCIHVVAQHDVVVRVCRKLGWLCHQI